MIVLFILILLSFLITGGIEQTIVEPINTLISETT